MRQSRGRLITVLLAAFTLLLGVNLAAYAANGRPVLLGKANNATKMTKIKNTGNGSALQLKSDKGVAPLKVSNSKRVKKLNADLVDGADSTALETKTYVYNLAGTTATQLVRFSFPGLPAGQYVATYAVSATLSGAGSYFGCLFDSGAAFTTSRLPNLGVTSGANAWYVSGSGPLDASSVTYTLTCQSSVSGYTVPNTATGAPSQVSFTRVDDMTTANSTGVAAKSSGKGLGGN